MRRARIMRRTCRSVRRRISAGPLLVLLASVACSYTSPHLNEPSLDPVPDPDPDALRTRVMLVGDAGAPRDDEPTLMVLEKWATTVPDRSLIIYLGDNLYPNGLPPESDSWRSEGERRLGVQVRTIADSGARGLFIPGNHDWGSKDAQGLTRLEAQAEFVTATLGPDAFKPTPGCPGPDSIDLDGMRVVILDTQWWLNRKPAPPSTPCAHADTAEVLAAVARLIETADDRMVIVAGHHPLSTHGPHGGFYDWQDHIFPTTRAVKWLWLPLPVVGSLYPLMRWQVVRNPQDMKAKSNRTMVASLGTTLSVDPPLAYVAGHEHGLQVLDGGEAAGYILVSGAGIDSKLEAIGGGDDTIFAHQHAGFMVLDLLRDGRVLLRVVEADPDDPSGETVVFARWLTR